MALLPYTVISLITDTLSHPFEVFRPRTAGHDSLDANLARLPQPHGERGMRWFSASTPESRLGHALIREPFP